MTGSRSRDSEQVTQKPNSDSDPASKKARGLTIEGYPVEGMSIGGHETCIIFPTLNLSFDIGRCPQRAISQDFLFISHAHMDHIVCMHTFLISSLLICVLGSFYVPVYIYGFCFHLIFLLDECQVLFSLDLLTFVFSSTHL